MIFYKVYIFCGYASKRALTTGKSFEIEPYG
jgi:hypothetical protein